jgi:hypothetical protein
MNGRFVIGKSYYNPVAKNKDKDSDSSDIDYNDIEDELNNESSIDSSSSCKALEDKLKESLKEDSTPIINNEKPLTYNSLQTQTDNFNSTSTLNESKFSSTNVESTTTQTDNFNSTSTLNESTATDATLNDETNDEISSESTDDISSDNEEVLSSLNILSDTLNSHIKQYGKHKALINTSFSTIISRLKTLEKDDLNIYNLYNKLIAEYNQNITTINASIDKLNSDMEMCKKAMQIIANQCNITFN